MVRDVEDGAVPRREREKLPEGTAVVPEGEVELLYMRRGLQKLHSSEGADRNTGIRGTTKHKKKILYLPLF